MATESQRGVVLYDAESDNASIMLSHENSFIDSEQESIEIPNVFARKPPPASYTFRTNFTTKSGMFDANYSEDAILEEFPTKGISLRHDDELLDSSKMLNSLAILAGAGIGLGIGFGLSRLTISPDAMAWIELPGVLFVRALRCLIVPMVFCSMVASVADVVAAKKTTLLGWRTVLTFLLTSAVAALQGILIAIIFKDHFVSNVNVATSTNQTKNATLSIQCNNNMYMVMLPNGQVTCTSEGATSNTTLFNAIDINDSMQVNSQFESLTLTEQLISVLHLVVPDNIFGAIRQSSLVSVIMFAIPFGVAIAKSDNCSISSNTLVNLMKQTRNMMLMLIYMIMRLTPIAVAFLIASAVISFSSNAGDVAGQVGFAIAAFVTCSALHCLIVMPILLFVTTRINPYAYLSQLTSAYVFAFSCSSSMATLPIAVSSIQQTRQVSRAFAQLIMTLGTPVNLNACGLYYPIQVVFMANMSGLGGHLRLPQWIILYFVSILATMGTAPVPNSGLVMLMTVWNTVLPDDNLPASFSYIVAIDFIMDRIATMVNVNGNMVVTRILAEHVDEAVEVWANDQVIRSENTDTSRSI